MYLSGTIVNVSSRDVAKCIRKYKANGSLVDMQWLLIHRHLVPE